VFGKREEKERWEKRRWRRGSRKEVDKDEDEKEEEERKKRRRKKKNNVGVFCVETKRKLSRLLLLLRNAIEQSSSSGQVGARSVLYCCDRILRNNQ
jgi:hypothetical protein